MRTLGLDLGGTKIAAAVVEEGTILERCRVATPQAGFASVLEALIEAASTLLKAGFEVAAVGVGSPGPLDLRAGTVVFAPNISGMEDAPIVAELERKLAMPVFLENDANAAGYAEHLYGAAIDLETSVFITMSTGIGGGLFLGDTIIHGAHDIAGEIGQMTLLPGGPQGGDGHDGSWEAIAAGRSIARDGSYTYNQTMTTEEVFRRARAGEAKAARIVANAARFTGIGIANLVKVFDPEGFVIGGGMSQAGSFYLDQIRAAAADYLVGYPEALVRTARLGTDAGVIGAASVAAKGIAATR